MCTIKKLFFGFSNFAILLCFSIVSVCFSFVWSYDFHYEKDEMAPVVLVPGIGGSQLEGKWKTQDHPPFCNAESSGWELLWINWRVFTSNKGILCWIYRYKLIYDRVKRKCRNQEGVETRVIGRFGSLKPIAYLTSDRFTQISTGYFDGIAKALIRSGYTSRRKLKAAAYDSRYAPIQLDEFGYFRSLKHLIEQVALHSGRKVAIVAHSMGGLVAAYFLTNTSQKWKDKYIHAFIPISTPWLGSPMALQSFIMGTNFDIPGLKKSVSKELVRSFQSLAALLPSEEAFKNTVLVDWPEGEKKYAAKDYKQLFKDMSYEDGYRMRKDVRSLMPVSGKKLGVDVFCVWSDSVKTPFTMTIEGDIQDPKSIKNEEVDGDGKVPLESLRYCETFPRVTVKSFSGLDHRNIVYSEGVTDFIKSALSKSRPEEDSELRKGVVRRAKAILTNTASFYFSRIGSSSSGESSGTVPVSWDIPPPPPQSKWGKIKECVCRPPGLPGFDYIRRGGRNVQEKTVGYLKDASTKLSRKAPGC